MKTDELTIGEWVAEKPACSRIFERYGIDYCCGGKKHLDEVCAARGLNMEEVTRELKNCGGTLAEEKDWASATLTELTRHIEDVHHAYLKSELPRLSELIDKVSAVHGEHHPELRKIMAVYRDFRCEMEQHMWKEEHVLFPFCRELETAATLPSFHCGTVANPIQVMEYEHDHAGAALLSFRVLTNNFKVPDDACTSYDAMLEGLARLELDMKQHVHEENNILFPRTLERETQLKTGTAQCTPRIL